MEVLRVAHGAIVFRAFDILMTRQHDVGMETALLAGPDPRRHQRRAMALGAALLAALVGSCVVGSDRKARSPTASLEELFRDKRSGVVVEGSGSVSKILADDLKGSRHQRFILRLESGRTLLVSHNIDLAPRIEGLSQGDRVAFRGQYEWNERGGVVHWTHRDPADGRPGGWLQHRDRTYR